MLSNNKQQYCFESGVYASVLKENASIRRRGILVSVWGYTRDRFSLITITPHTKERNVFVRCYV